ncbi:F-box only protein 2 isoform X2 [Hyla sarda]|uniref:F-box only protein 2 isoform X2 n=1 Tax=Hyla sarda TaxID=327740 RepID=UPI0024C333DF|nr:F-box only protein 2 isoform X2 [Hyla sarda]
MARNLIKNPCGEEEFKYWEIVEDGGDGWKVEKLPGDCGVAFPAGGIFKYFTTSSKCCSKTQVIDLLKEGYLKRLLDTSPKIVVSDWYAGRTDAGCTYQLKVQLLSESRQVISEYSSENIAIPKTNNGAWAQIRHAFSGYGSGVRFIQFTHCGQDSVSWKGWYGVRVTNSSVIIEK